MGSAPEAQTPEQTMTPEEKALKSKLTGISSQYSDILSKQYPGYEKKSGLSSKRQDKNLLSLLAQGI